MAWVFEKSPTWRRIVAKTRESPSFYAGFAAACFVVPYGLGKAVMWATNPEVARKRDMALQAELKGRQTYHHEVSHAEWLHSNAGANSVESVWQRYINGPQSSVLQLRVLVCMYVCVRTCKDSHRCTASGHSGCQQAYCVGMLSLLARIVSVSASLLCCVRAESRKSKSTKACRLAGGGSKR